MPINPLPAIAKYESSGCTDNYTSLSSSSGCYGYLDSSWKEYSKLVQGASQYARAADAPVSVQTAVAAATINKDGIQPWDCKGCDPKFSAYVAANGGVSNFQTSGLSTNPADYSSLDTASGLSSYFGSSGSSTITVGDGSLATTPSGTAAVTASDPTTTTGTINVGALGSPWQWTWTQIIVNTDEPIKTALTNIETMSAAVLGGILLIAMVAMGLRGMLRRADASDFVHFFIKAGFVLAFVSVGSAYYNDYVVTPVNNLPTWWQKYLTGAASDFTSPIAMFDWVDTQVEATVSAIRNTLPWYAFDEKLSILGGRFVIWLALCAMFLAKAGFTIFVRIATSIGPLLIPAALFPKTEGLFWGWVGVVITGMLTLLGIDIALGLYAPVMIKLIRALTTTEGSVWGCAVAMFAMGSAVGFLPIMWSKIGGGVSASLSHASGFMSGATPAAIAGGAALAGAAGLAIAGGASAGATMAVTRLTSAVGSSLSRGL